MKNLEIKHLAAYLPYGLKILDVRNNTIIEMTALNVNINLSENFKPILMPLYHLPQEIVDMSPYDNHDELIEAIEDQTCPHNIWRVCVSNHFDVFGLIDAGFAINKLTI